jgi:hypothetical protein
MSMVEISWRPDVVEMRKFGLVTIIGLCLIGAGFQFLGDNVPAAIGIYIAAGVIGLPALTGTSIGLPGYWLWMGVAFVMGNIISRLLLTLIYYLLLTPIALFRRLLGNDRLKLKKRDVETHWVTLEEQEDQSRYERQF